MSDWISSSFTEDMYNCNLKDKFCELIWIAPLPVNQDTISFSITVKSPEGNDMIPIKR